MTLTAPLPTARLALAAANVSNSLHYDLVPYASNPFPLTQPARLAGLARLFGLDAPPVATARVLELGCAGGGNLIPLAMRFPDARFIGVDLSPQQIAQGRARIERLHLTNIELQCRDLTKIDANDGAFDYIICHGVYSWVPYEARQAILRIAAQRLAPDGVAYVSYNVLPGWRLRQGMRDSMLLYTGLEESPTHRISRARWLLNMMKERTNENTFYGRLWRAESERIEQLSDGHLSHEFLEDANEPFSFSEFMADAVGAGLSYLAEADFFSMAPENFGSDVGQIIREMSGDLLFPIEQNIDIVTGRPFRQTLLVHEQRASAISRNLAPSRLQGLHLVAPLGLSGAADPDRLGTWVFSDSTGSKKLTTASVAAAHAIRRVIERLPASTSVNELIEPLASKSGDDVTLDALFKMMVIGLLAPSIEPVSGVSVLPDYPIADRLAASDAASGADSTVNQRHERVEFGAVGRVVLPLLDGTRDRAALVAAVLDQARKGHIHFSNNGVRIDKEEEFEASASAHVDAVLIFAQRSGLLVERNGSANPSPAPREKVARRSRVG